MIRFVSILLVAVCANSASIASIKPNNAFPKVFETVSSNHNSGHGLESQNVLSINEDCAVVRGVGLKCWGFLGTNIALPKIHDRDLSKVKLVSGLHQYNLHPMGHTDHFSCFIDDGKPICFGSYTPYIISVGNDEKIAKLMDQKLKNKKIIDIASSAQSANTLCFLDQEKTAHCLGYSGGGYEPSEIFWTEYKNIVAMKSVGLTVALLEQIENNSFRLVFPVYVANAANPSGYLSTNVPFQDVKSFKLSVTVVPPSVYTTTLRICVLGNRKISAALEDEHLPCDTLTKNLHGDMFVKVDALILPKDYPRKNIKEIDNGDCFLDTKNNLVCVDYVVLSNGDVAPANYVSFCSLEEIRCPKVTHVARVIAKDVSFFYSSGGWNPQFATSEQTLRYFKNGEGTSCNANRAIHKNFFSLYKPRVLMQSDLIDCQDSFDIPAFQSTSRFGNVNGSTGYCGVTIDGKPRCFGVYQPDPYIGTGFDSFPLELIADVYSGKINRFSPNGCVRIGRKLKCVDRKKGLVELDGTINADDIIDSSVVVNEDMYRDQIGYFESTCAILDSKPLFYTCTDGTIFEISRVRKSGSIGVVDGRESFTCSPLNAEYSCLREDYFANPYIGWRLTSSYSFKGPVRSIWLDLHFYKPTAEGFLPNDHHTVCALNPEGKVSCLNSSFSTSL